MMADPIVQVEFASDYKTKKPHRHQVGLLKFLAIYCLLNSLAMSFKGYDKLLTK